MSEPSHLVGLNAEQHDAVTTVEGPLLVLAGAGSGKTRVLTRRIAHLLHLGVNPENILAVTFTNKAAAEMKERVAELVGEVGHKVWISTFHASCGRILRKDIEALGYTRRFSIYDDDDQHRIVKHLIVTDGRMEKDRARAILGKIDHYKNRMMTPDEVVAQRRSHINDPLIRIWRQYDEQLRAADAVDFNDLINLVVRLFKEHPNILEKWREKFHYILVDEYQDTNHSQYTLLRLLADRRRNLAVVGDDDQSIYGFRGADISNILGFNKDYPEAKVIRLEQNYRSSANILTLSNAVVQVNSGRMDKKLWTQADAGPKTKFLVCQDPRHEAKTVARAIQQLRYKGFQYGDIAIIYRTNATSRPFEMALRDARIPHRIVGGRKFYERREIRDVLAFLRLVVNPADDAAFLRVVNVPPRGIGAKTIAKLREDAGERSEPLLATARALARGTSRKARAFTAFIEIIDALADAAKSYVPVEVVRLTLETSGYEAMLTADEETSRLENLQALLMDAAGFTPESGVTSPMELLQAWLDRSTLSGATDEIPDGGEVTLMTVHNAKGLEYPVVFVVQMNEGKFPHSRSVDEPKQLEEERRLAYVAFTRAMKRLIITYTHTWSSPFGTGWGGGAPTQQPVAPSRFLHDLPPDVCIDGPPSAEPSSATTARPMGNDRFATFMSNERRRQQSLTQRELPEDTYTTVEIETPDQLARGVRVFHPQYGVGEVRRVRGSGPLCTAEILFGDRKKSVPLQSPSLRILVE